VLDNAHPVRGSHIEPIRLRVAKLPHWLASKSKCLAASHKSRMRDKTTKARSSALAVGRDFGETDG
jgi:hypothetical protein